MTGGLEYISNWQLALALLFVGISGAVSLWRKLELEKDLTVGTVRTFVQLFIMGYALQLIFSLEWALLSLGVYLVMVIFAARIVRGRVKEKDVDYLMPTFVAMLVSYFLVTTVVTGLVVQAEPWWRPQYFLPIGGMVIGNSMTALALSLERLFSDLRNQRAQVEMRLCLGASPAEAGRESFKDALKAGMIPSINSMMGVGVVFIPGMMTGQILAGADPLEAVRYQIVVMLMLVGSTAISSVIVVGLAFRRCFAEGDRLALRPK